MREVKQIRLFISCPGDVKDELNSIHLIIQDINKTIGRQNNYVLELLNWRTDTYTAVGEDAQDVINKQLDDKYDILVGIIWLRLGTPTKRDKSGTVEEINRALSNNEKDQLIYFKTTPPIDISDIDPEELSKINKFKKELGNKGVLYHEFSSTSKFESLLRIQLTNLIFDKLTITKKDVLVPSNGMSLAVVEDKYANISSFLEEVENIDDSTLELDIFNLVGEAESNLNLLTNSLNSMSESMRDWTKIMESRTGELNVINNIKDQKLKIAKQKTVINLLANELLDFNNRIRKELPVFSENFKKVGSSYSNVILIVKGFNNDEAETIRESVISLRDNSEKSLDGLVVLLKAMMNFPPLNFKFNKARRETELTLKTLIQETMEGLKLLDEALKN